MKKCLALLMALLMLLGGIFIEQRNQLFDPDPERRFFKGLFRPARNKKNTDDGKKKHQNNNGQNTIFYKI